MPKEIDCPANLWEVLPSGQLKRIEPPEIKSQTYKKGTRPPCPNMVTDQRHDKKRDEVVPIYCGVLVYLANMGYREWRGREFQAGRCIQCRSGRKAGYVTTAERPIRDSEIAARK